VKVIFNISLICFSFLSCQTESSANSAMEVDSTDIAQIYENEYGQVELRQLNDTLWQTIFTNNEGFVFDTSITTSTDGGFFRFQDSNSVFLPYNWGGVNFTESELFVTEFSSYGMLASEANIWEMYERSFFRKGQKVHFQGDVYREKDGLKAKGMYIQLRENKIEPGYYNITGTIKKEKYPINYYSIDKSPQGKLGNDTTKIFYRLLLEDPVFELPEPFLYEGSKINTALGKAAIVWNWADSESYQIDSLGAWPTSQLGNPVKIKGYLSQTVFGSVLKNWKIID
jgi:hypothetical protein